MHTSLQACLTLVPSGRSKLFGVLRQHYPHRRMRAEALSDYALQALRVVQYAPLIEVYALQGLFLLECVCGMGEGGGGFWCSSSAALRDILDVPEHWS